MSLEDLLELLSHPKKEELVKFFCQNKGCSNSLTTWYDEQNISDTHILEILRIFLNDDINCPEAFLFLTHLFSNSHYISSFPIDLSDAGRCDVRFLLKYFQYRVSGDYLSPTLLADDIESYYKVNFHWNPENHHIWVQHSLSVDELGNFYSQHFQFPPIEGQHSDHDLVSHAMTGQFPTGEGEVAGCPGDLMFHMLASPKRIVPVSEMRKSINWAFQMRASYSRNGQLDIDIVTDDFVYESFVRMIHLVRCYDIVNERMFGGIKDVNPFQWRVPLI